MPSKCTLVPGSHGPSASGSVITPISEVEVTVPTDRLLSAAGTLLVVTAASPKFLAPPTLESCVDVTSIVLLLLDAVVEKRPLLECGVVRKLFGGNASDDVTDDDVIEDGLGAIVVDFADWFFDWSFEFDDDDDTCC